MRTQIPRCASSYPLLAVLIIACLFISLLQGCRKPGQPVVVVYTALDRTFSEPILNEFEKKTGTKVLVKYDTEATKTVGLVNTIRSEKNRPRCDVFWNNEIVNTIRLKNEGLLEKFTPAAASAFPAAFRDAEGYWCGFAARARVLLVNTNLVSSEQMPNSIYDLADTRWKGRVGIGKPLFGTTATHAACLFAILGDAKAQSLLESLKANEIRIEAGNKAVALSVAAGTLAFGLTDTDDAIKEVEGGKPVAIVYPDGRDDQMGVLFIPNSLSLIKNAPHRTDGEKLIEYLLSPEVESALAMSQSAQIPLNPAVKTKSRVKTPADVKVMAADFPEAAQAFARSVACVEKLFLE